ncbi:MAG: signal peptidase I [Candidatus Zambryskibacteria bacterium]|nr:signal peptidase I [Candidatus Zambryskibacteria bacterium]
MDSAEEKNPPANSRSEFWKELAKLVILSVVIVIPFRTYIAQPFIVDGSSMFPTFKNGQYLIVDEVTYHFNNPERGSVLIFKYPLDPKKKFIKRIIGLPSETVSIKEGKVTIKNTEHPDGLLLDESYIELSKPDSVDYTLGEDEYFVMGDNRAASADSREWGPVPRANMLGRPVLRLYPPTFMPGEISYSIDSLSSNP